MQQMTLTLDHDNFYCPATGQQILSEEEFKPSPATAFVYSPEIEEFEYTTELSEALDSQSNPPEIMKEIPWGRFERFSDAIKDSNIVCFSITTYDLMACGRVSTTVYIGIDMNYCLEEEK